MPYRSVEQRRRDLIDAAIRVMSDAGVAAASTRAICAEAGVQQSVFHYCFESKDELLRELTRDVVAANLEAAVGLLDPGEGVEESVRVGLWAVWETGSVNTGRQLALYELTVGALRAPDRGDIAEWQYQVLYDAAEVFLVQIAENSRVAWSTPVPVLARLVISVLDGIVLGWLVDRDVDQVDTTLRAFAQMFAGFAVPVGVTGIAV